MPGLPIPGLKFGRQSLSIYPRVHLITLCLSTFEMVDYDVRLALD